MDEDMRDRFDEDEEEVLETSQPFFQTLIGKIVLIAIALVVVVLASILVSNIVYNIRNGEREAEEARKLRNQQEMEVGMDNQPLLVKHSKTLLLDPMNLNLDDPGAYLSVEVGLAYDSTQKDLEYELSKRKAQILSIVRFILESNTRDQVDTVDERNKILKPKILNRVNEILSYGKIYDIYFPAFTVQYSPVN